MEIETGKYKPEGVLNEQKFIKKFMEYNLNGHGNLDMNGETVVTENLIALQILKLCKIISMVNFF